MHVVTLCLMAAAVAASEPEAVVLEFTAPDRCPPCQQIAPLVHRLQREGYPLQIINADEKVFVCQQHRIVSIPTFVLIISGREVDRIEGKPPESELRRLCERARLANATAMAKAAATKSPTEDDKSQAVTASAPARPTASSPKSETKPPKAQPAARAADEPIIRAKHDDSVNLPKPGSTDPLHVCPRIRVKDALGVNFGTGTIIDSREGRTTILTCGHLFRKLDDQSVIEVDVFNGSKHETFVGRLMRYDLEADVGLLWIPTTRPLPAAAIAGLDEAPTVGQHVFSVGCSGGDPPSKLQHRVTWLNRYNGPDNIECTGVPVQGRSGGGLFDTSGRLVGVCIAADQRDQRGLYAALAPIHDLLDKAKLSHLHPTNPSQALPESVATRPATAELRSEPSDPSAPARQPSIDRDEPKFEADEPPADELAGPFASSKASGVLADVAAVPDSAVATLGMPVTPTMSAANLDDRFDPNSESEVVCIIRPLNNPRAASRVVIINRASSKFLAQLSGELEQQAKPTSAVVREAKYAAPVQRPYRRTRENSKPDLQTLK